MTLHLPWLELAIALPLLGGLLVSLTRNPERAQAWSILFFSLTLLCTVGEWIDFGTLHTFEAHDRWYFISGYLGPDAIVVDELSAPLLPLVALQHLLTAFVTLRTKVRRFSFGWTLVSEAIVLATLSCRSPWGLVALLSLGALPPLIELRQRHKPWRVYALHMGLFVLLLASGQALMAGSAAETSAPFLAVCLLTAAMLLRSGIVPVHCWMTDLFEHATFGTALLTVTPMIGAYGMMRLVLPIAPDWALRTIALVSLLTAVYAAGMALVQHEARRFFCYLFLSHSSLLLVGMETATPVGLTGALSVWLSVGLALTGFGLTLRSMESRLGRISLDRFHGMYAHTPRLATLFLLTGLASVGFPGTFGFVGMELLVDGIVHEFPLAGIAVVVAAAINGIAVMHAYFRIFTGTERQTSVSLVSRPREVVAVLLLALLILGGGLWPQPGIASRYHAAVQLIAARERTLPSDRTNEHQDKDHVTLTDQHDE